ncbi:MAG TPA: MucR family transcriptional regulator [Stellaceae bacterium]
MTLLSSVTEIVSVYLQQNKAEPKQLSQIITSVTDALRTALSGTPGSAAEMQQDSADASGESHAAENAAEVAQPAAAAAPAPVEPAVPVEDSVASDYLICLECGLKQKLLKKHLRIAHGLSPQDYRKRWSLDAKYPMAAPSFAEGKREMAKRIGLGRGRPGGATGKGAPEAAPAAAPVASAPERKRGRGRKPSAAAGQNSVGSGKSTGRGRRSKSAGVSAGIA